ncbi:TetR family transcriptional regulator [Ciceribacter naphthalenivorans]|uniref:TetR family transcriptional regulator n=3 Tax=Alphaproteobacteria TaxID=28211 RepID=A0A512HN76_9HYPH|nr:TetR family transcriptional regulator [Ciceribacter naphthalenivorans]GEO86892.1 TetR family transcriptional regulator [Ciceribacter naphthalenivorans]GLR22206.1 TetR family transcriptional regulator [Ciceribacter naphthalenivorans]GLT05062.1 TetR family transcriptional regulator [Sphingomonas psychrolutea]
MAEELFRTRGYASVAIADIAAALGMSPANVFKHFHSKTSLVDAISAHHIETTLARLACLDAGKPAPERLYDLVKQLMDSHLRDLAENPYLFEMVLLTAKDDLECGHRYRDMLLATVRTIIDDGIVQGTYTATNSRQAAQTAIFALACVLHPVMIANEKADILATRCREVVALINAALQSPLAK